VYQALPNSRSLLIAAVGGLIAAAMYLAVVAGGLGGMILVYLAPLPVFAVGLGLGTPAVVVAGAVGALAIALIGGPMAAAQFAATIGLPVGFVVRQALRCRPVAVDGMPPEGSSAHQDGPAHQDGLGGRVKIAVEWYPPGGLVSWLCGFALVAFILALPFLAGDHGDIEASVRQFLIDALGALPGSGTGATAGMADARLAEIATQFAAWLPGLMATFWVLMLAVNGVLAQGVLVRFGRNLRPSPTVAAITVPVVIPVAFAAAVLLGAVDTGEAGVIGRNLALILAVPLFFGGLAVVHALAKRVKARVPILVGIYVALFLLGWPIVVIVALGMIEQWVGLRGRLARSTPSSGEE